MIEINGQERENYKYFFETCEDSCIITAISGKGGKLFVDDKENPECAMIVVGDYVFLAGSAEGKNAKELTELADSLFTEGFNIRCVSAGFVELINEVYFGRINRYTRFATKRSFDKMNFEWLKEVAASLPEGFYIKAIDEDLYDYCMNNEWAGNFVTSFENLTDWVENGFGLMIMHEDEPVAGASSYSSYPGGIEVEIITREDYRKRGFALITGAALLLECKKRGILASWDAAHERSLRLAQKLGFEFLYEYDCYNVSKKAL